MNTVNQLMFSAILEAKGIEKSLEFLEGVKKDSPEEWEDTKRKYFYTLENRARTALLFRNIGEAEVLYTFLQDPDGLKSCAEHYFAQGLITDGVRIYKEKLGMDPPVDVLNTHAFAWKQIAGCNVPDKIFAMKTSFCLYTMAKNLGGMIDCTILLLYKKGEDDIETKKRMFALGCKFLQDVLMSIKENKTHIDQNKKSNLFLSSKEVVLQSKNENELVIALEIFVLLGDISWVVKTGNAAVSLGQEELARKAFGAAVALEAKRTRVDSEKSEKEEEEE